MPITLPPVELDTTDDPYGAGYHYSPSLSEAARTSGFWPNGRPARCVSVIANEDAIERTLSTGFGETSRVSDPYDTFVLYDLYTARVRRASTLTISALCSNDEIRAAMREIVSWARTTAQLVEEQWAWYVALGRPSPDEGKVLEGLHAALAHRKLDWTVKRFESAMDAWAARSGQLAWPAVNDGAADLDDEWPNPNSELSGPTVDLWPEPIAIANLTLHAWNAQWDRWHAWDVYVANQAKSALAQYLAVSEGWFTNKRADRLSVGLRDAYYHGLAIAVPTGARELGYAMDSRT